MHWINPSQRLLQCLDFPQEFLLHGQHLVGRQLGGGIVMVVMAVARMIVLVFKARYFDKSAFPLGQCHGQAVEPGVWLTS